MATLKKRSEVKKPSTLEKRRSSDNNKPASPKANSSGFRVLAGLIALLCTFGLMMVLSSSSVASLRYYGSSWHFFSKQVIWLGLGVTALILASRFDYRLLRRYRFLLLLVSLVLLVLVLVPGLGVTVYGAKRWLGYGNFRFQPSEIAKLALLVFAADMFSMRQHLVNDWRAVLKPVAIVFGVLGSLVLIEPDLGTTLIMTAIVAVVVFAGGSPIKLLGKIAAFVVAAVAILAIVEPYRRRRVLAFLHPFETSSDEGYQIVQSFYAIAAGGIGGLGIGESRAKWGFLPNAHTDFIFAIIAEEIGLVGATLVIIMFVCFAALGIRSAIRAPDQFGMLMAVGITTWIVLQAVLNIGAVIGVVPVTGVPLPFVSQGGSSLIMLMAASGILLNITKQGDNSHNPKRRATDIPERVVDIR